MSPQSISFPLYNAYTCAPSSELGEQNSAHLASTVRVIWQHDLGYLLPGSNALLLPSIRQSFFIFEVTGHRGCHSPPHEYLKPIS